MRTKYTLDRIRLRIEPRRPDGTPADVDALQTKWQRLLDLGPGGPDACGHDHECDEYLERNTAVNDAAARVSQRQEHRVFRGLTVHHAPSPLDGLLERVCSRWGRS